MKTRVIQLIRVNESSCIVNLFYRLQLLCIVFYMVSHHEKILVKRYSKCTRNGIVIVKTDVKIKAAARTVVRHPESS